MNENGKSPKDKIRLECLCPEFGRELPSNWPEDGCDDCPVKTDCLKEWLEPGTYEIVRPPEPAELQV